MDGAAEGRDGDPVDPVLEDDEVVTAEPERKRLSKGTRSLIEWVVVIAAALTVALLVRTFLLAAFYIPSESMETTLNIGDRVLVNKVSYHLHDIHRGDVVVFKRPPGETDATIKDLIKRVVALPGENVACQDQRIVVNGRLLEEPYLDTGVAACGVGSCELKPQTVPDGFIWVMGDNRGASQDSRCFGPIAEKLVVGRAFVRVWPLSHLGWL